MSQSLPKLPIGVQSFVKLIEGHYLYVDKTDYIYKLADNGTQYFLSRPRRFGKSLLLSTMKAYWQGQKELFEGLAIEKLEATKPDPWQNYPVFYFDFNGKNYQNEFALEEILNEHLERWEKIYYINGSENPLEERFETLLKTASAQSGLRCVVLVDEYDKSLLESLENPDIQEHNKAVFKGFFGRLKSCDEYLQFVFITGVTKFSKVSIFSDLNQLRDISLDTEYSGLCGITEAELLANFMPFIQNMAVARKLSPEGCLSRLKQTYDGYHFSEDSPGVYNPFSVLNAFAEKKFRYYWFETGTPTFLVNRLSHMGFDVRQLSDQSIIATEAILSDYRAENPDPIPLLYQTGYLTILDFDEDAGIYTLGFPNNEVRYGLLSSMMPAYMPNTNAALGKDVLSIRRYLESGDLEMLQYALTALYSGIPYTGNSVEYEAYFQSVIYILFTLLGQYVRCEVHSARGRADCIVETKNYIYLFEFKRDKSADEALEQIERNGYALPYAADPRKLYRIGVNFDSQSRNISDWKVV